MPPPRGRADGREFWVDNEAMVLPTRDELTQRSRAQYDAYGERIKEARQQEAAHEAYHRNRTFLRARGGGAMPTVPILAVIFDA